MDKYFVVKSNSTLYADFFSYREDSKKINEAFKQLAAKHGIETREYYPSKTLGIVGTKNDLANLENQLKKDSEFFKIKSQINKEWVELTKDIVTWRKPVPEHYLKIWIMGKCRTRLFNIEDVLYCSIEADGDFATEEWMQEMKASEFFKVIETYEEREVK